MWTIECWLQLFNLHLLYIVAVLVKNEDFFKKNIEMELMLDLY